MDNPLPQSSSSLPAESAGLFYCDYYDSEAAKRIEEMLLLGLASTCVDSTKADLFKSPSSVVAEIRAEMEEYLMNRSKAYYAEYITPQNVEFESTGDTFNGNPISIISKFLDEFSTSKLNLLSRVSGWLLSESRDEKVNKFLLEIEAYMFWPTHEREVLTTTILRIVDCERKFHCHTRFTSFDSYGEHRNKCEFRPVSCLNEGCASCFSARYLLKHDSECPFKMLPCQQNCSQHVARQEMSRHCKTVCPMKIVNCPFMEAGCHANFPQHETEKHLSEFLHSHLLYILRIISKQESFIDELNQRILLLEKAQSLNEQSEALDVRSLTLAIKEQQAKMKRLESNVGKLAQRNS